MRGRLPGEHTFQQATSRTDLLVAIAFSVATHSLMVTVFKYGGWAYSGSQHMFFYVHQSHRHKTHTQSHYDTHTTDFLRVGEHSGIAMVLPLSQTQKPITEVGFSMDRDSKALFIRPCYQTMHTKIWEDLSDARYQITKVVNGPLFCFMVP